MIELNTLDGCNDKSWSTKTDYTKEDRHIVHQALRKLLISAPVIRTQLLDTLEHSLSTRTMHRRPTSTWLRVHLPPSSSRPRAEEADTRRRGRNILGIRMLVAALQRSAVFGEGYLDECGCEVNSGTTVDEVFGQRCAVASALTSHQGDPGSLPDFRMWESCWTIPLAGGFSRGTTVSPALAFQIRSILGSHFMSCSRITGTFWSRLESPSLGGCRHSSGNNREPWGVVVRLFPHTLSPRRSGLNYWRGRPRIFARGIRAGRYRWLAAFIGDLPFPRPLHSCAAPFSPHFTLISSQDLDVKSRQNLSTPLQSKNNEISSFSPSLSFAVVKCESAHNAYGEIFTTSRPADVMIIP
ncbi:hypothetical protein PR048_017675 [Dryococelus australis]|uniref:Uncharacterized protein n=1 Tax=Dryococelus australis TaxID=614101 RepID=A0ABQ9HA63_9NEOP|nr:hypothetical protein PR048_017675 [Dryococelus australis]